MSKDNVSVSGTFLHQTERSIFIEVDGEEVNLPLSEIQMDDGDYARGDRIDIVVPGWLAKNRGLE